MIVNGGSYRAINWWADHLQSKDNDRARVVKSYGLRSEDIRGMLFEMEAHAQGTRCENFFYQMNLNPALGERLTEEQWDKAREIAEKKHGLEGQPYFVVEHVKHGRPHQHIVWSRIDLEAGRAISDSNDAKKNHAIAREIEREFGLEKVVGPYDREQGTPRPARAPKSWEMYRGMKTDIDPRDIAAEVTELFHQSDSGKALQAALELHGYELLKGDRRGFVILDSAGKDHSLARRLDGVNAKELNAFMRDVDREGLPTVKQGKAQFQERKIAGLEADRATIAHEIEWEEALAKAAIAKEEAGRKFVEPKAQERTARGQQEKEKGGASQPEPTKPVALELGRTAREIRLAYSLTNTGQEFANALEDRGLILAQVTEADAERLNRWERQRLNELKELEKAVLEASRQEHAQQPGAGRSDRADMWFSQTGGVESLTPEMREKAADRYAVWRHKERYDFAEYVEFVQNREAEKRHGPQIEAKEHERYKVGELVVVDQWSNVYQLSFTNTGDALKDREARLKDIDRGPLLSVSAADSVVKRLSTHQKEERDYAWRENRRVASNERSSPINPPQSDYKSPGLFQQAAGEAGRDGRTENLTGVAARVWDLWSQIDRDKHGDVTDFERQYRSREGFSIATDPKAFAAALDERGVMFAAVTKEEAARSNRDAAFAKAVGNHTPRYREGEIVIVTEPRPEYRREGEIVVPRRVHKVDQSLGEKFVSAIGEKGKLQGIEATLTRSDDRAYRRSEERESILEAAQARSNRRNFVDAVTRSVKPAKIATKGIKVGAIIGKGTGQALEVVGGIVEGLFGAAQTPEQKRDGDAAIKHRADEAADHIDFSKYTTEAAQQRRQEQHDREAERSRDRGGRER